MRWSTKAFTLSVYTVRNEGVGGSNPSCGTI